MIKYKCVVCVNSGPKSNLEPLRSGPQPGPKFILGFIIIRIGCGFLFIEQSFLFILAIVTSETTHFLLLEQPNFLN